MRILHNLTAYRGDVVMTTLTAPSLPWDESHCAARGPHKHRGGEGCQVLADVAGDFNFTASDRYSALHKAAAQAVYRKHGRYPPRLVYAPELQARGVIHWHIVLGFDGPGERSRARHYVNELHRLAGDYGYGFVDRKFKPTPSYRAASYIAKYMTKVERGGGLRELIVMQQCPARPVYVHRQLTAETRCTTRNLRLRRAVWMIWSVRFDLRGTELVWRAIPRSEKGLPAAVLAWIDTVESASAA